MICFFFHKIKDETTIVFLKAFYLWDKVAMYIIRIILTLVPLYWSFNVSTHFLELTDKRLFIDSKQLFLRTMNLNTFLTLIISNNLGEKKKATCLHFNFPAKEWNLKLNINFNLSLQPHLFSHHISSQNICL